MNRMDSTIPTNRFELAKATYRGGFSIKEGKSMITTAGIKIYITYLE